MRRIILALLLAAGPVLADTAERAAPLVPSASSARPEKASPWWRVGRVAGGLLLGTTAQVALAIGGGRLGLLLDPMRPGTMYEGTTTLGAFTGTFLGAIVGATLVVYGLGWLLMGDGALWATALGAAVPILLGILAALAAPVGGYLLLVAPYALPALGAVIGYEVTSSADRRVRVAVSALPVREGAGLAVAVAF